MRAEELRIGNLITDIWASEGSAFEVVSLSGKHTIVKYGAKFSAKIENLRPVPITEDWLKRFGFPRSDSIGKSPSFFYFYVGGSELHINPDNGVVWIERNANVFNNPALVKYVHQLQNLYFALTGEDLKLN